MKLHRLELTGFGPFRQTQVVDFDAFDDDGLFLISGRTGAGKSSILDGVSFALYGTVPRYEGGEKRLRSDHSFLTDPTEVRLEFTVRQTRWRVTRAPEYDRPAKRGGGVTTEIARAELEELVDGTWVGRAAKPRTVGEVLGDVLGVNAQQFQQVILLAQNKFSRFLLAPGEERQTLLRTLFGTKRFEQYRDDLEQRRRDAQRELSAVDARARTLLGEAERLIDEGGLADGRADGEERPVDLADRRAAADHSLQRAEYRVEQAATAQDRADAAHAAAAAAHAELVHRAQRGRDRAAARARLTELQEREPLIAADRARLERARAAATLRTPLETAERAERAHADAVAAAASAAAAWRDAGGDPGGDVRATLDALTGELARWEAALAHEADLGRAAAAVRDLERERSAVGELLTAIDQQLALIPDERAAIDEQLAAADHAASRVADVRATLAGAVDVRDAAREAATLATEVAAAESAYADAVAVAGAAGARVGELLRQRLAGYAGELAAGLVAGEPCAVCGSTEHPRPARRAGDPVTDDDLAEAERARDIAAAAEKQAAGVAHEARQRHAAVRERSGGIAPDAAAAAVAAAEAQLRAAEEAAAAAAALRDRRAELDELTAAAETERAALAERALRAGEQRAAVAADVARLEAMVAEARGGYDSVAARLAATTVQRDAARALVDADAALAERTRSRDAARADLQALIAASPFTSADDAVAALLEESALATLDATIAEHRAALIAAKQRLLELELDTAGDDVDEAQLAASATALADADAGRSAAIAAHRDAVGTAARLRGLLAQTDAAYADVAEAAEAAAIVTRLADTVAGRAPNTMKMDLETFVLAAELEEIVAAANIRLAEMSSGRYTLHHSDARAARGRASGLGIDVLDAHTGRLRPPQSLSGGETFLASLALALGLGEVVTARAGGIRLDTLFVDEGFGSLDPETLELAMRTLDELRAGGRTVGVISHVEAMKEQVPAQVLVEATPEGPSVIRQDAAVRR
ncbi:AAA family ATPase [Microbacterium aurum]|uniref:Nuclease SbcCD subunit C n=1 Tax=Microbacterium aurum TaxID=36805 RepID=A0A1P8U606_9MICO|nr:SMC family ATPase [Microbacterium aurum]APZ33513.1 ATPase [Microbacterium aurum]MBM7827198.1 exonuclease SbcC [Microbacterium aurum]